MPDPSTPFDSAEFDGRQRKGETMSSGYWWRLSPDQASMWKEIVNGPLVALKDLEKAGALPVAESLCRPPSVYAAAEGHLPL